MGHAGPLLVRADADAAMGVGHVMRCLALGQAWRRAGGEVTFAIHDPPPAVAGRIEHEGFVVRPIAPGSAALVDAWRAVGARWVVLDGYHFGPDAQVALKAARARVVVVDDNGESAPFVADVVLNPNVFAEAALYDGQAPQSALLLGPTYALIRDEFLRAARAGGERTRASVLLTFGGSDPAGLAEVAIAALREGRGEIDATLVVGSANPRAAAIGAAARGLEGLRVLYDTTEMAALMASADVAVTAAGGTCLELAFMRVPAIVVVVAENQRRVAEKLAALGVVRSLGAAPTVTSRKLADALADLLRDGGARTRMADSGRALVDGHGPDRVVRKLLEAA